MRHQLHAQNVFNMHLGVFARARHLHAATLAAASSVNLRLHHHARRALRKQFAGYRRGFFRRVRHFAPRHGNAVLREDSFAWYS